MLYLEFEPAKKWRRHNGARREGADVVASLYAGPSPDGRTGKLVDRDGVDGHGTGQV